MRIEHLNKIQLINADCMDVLRELPNNALGSGSICLAADAMGFEFTGIELDPEYYNAAKERLMKQQSEPQLFAAEDLVGNAWDGRGYLF